MNNQVAFWEPMCKSKTQTLFQTLRFKNLKPNSPKIHLIKFQTFTIRIVSGQKTLQT